MGSSLGLSLANTFLCHHEKKWLNDCPKKFKPEFYKRYVDDISVLFKRPEHVKPFVDYMNINIKTSIFLLKRKKMVKCPSLMSTFSVRIFSLEPMFTEKKHLLEFILTFPVSYH